jgi:hypothetical protein
LLSEHTKAYHISGGSEVSFSLNSAHSVVGLLRMTGEGSG